MAIKQIADETRVSSLDDGLVAWLANARAGY